MGEFSGTLSHVARAASRAFPTRRAAPEQGGLLAGSDPTEFNAKDPLRLFILQLALIIVFTQLLALIFRRLRQPRVIWEIIAGILLGPTGCMRSPAFREHIFPDASRSYLSLVATIGLVLFLFIVGLEIEGSVVKRNARLSLTVAVAGMVIPFGIGAGFSRPLYEEFTDKSNQFTHFMLFVGVSFAITAFPVLCRILTELKLLDTTVGIVVLSAGVGNDIVGWVLLALAVALVNGGQGLSALYILLVAIGWTLLLLIPGRIGVRWIARRTGSIENGPTVLFMTFTMLLMFCSAFFTDIIGVHPIFGAFLVGLIVPREGGLAIHITEKLEDIVAVVLLPLYFATSGLSTDLSQLNDGRSWAYVAGIISLAYISKFGGCALAARFAAGFNWRESAAIGSLMSCKGLVELVVLGVGLQAGILNTKLFSMFVLEALFLTFMTTPAVQYFYPPRVRVRVIAGNIKYAHTESKTEEQFAQSDRHSHDSGPIVEAYGKTRCTVVLDKLEHLPSMMTITQLLQPQNRLGRVDALRLIELSDRTSAVMRSGVADSLLLTDPLIGVVRTLGELNGFAVNAALSVVPAHSFASSVDEHVQDTESDLLLISWGVPRSRHTSHDEQPGTAPDTPAATAPTHNPFAALFAATDSGRATISDTNFVRGVFAGSSTDVALYVDPGQDVHAKSSSLGTKKRHFILPFVGGPDDRLALELVVQLCCASDTSATVVRLFKTEGMTEGQSSDLDALVDKPQAAHLGGERDKPTVTSIQQINDTVYDGVTTQTRLQSETADNVYWSRYAGSSERSAQGHPSASTSLPEAAVSALSRIEFTTLSTPAPLAAAVDLVRGALNPEVLTRANRRRVFAVVGRSRRMAVESHAKELAALLAGKGTAGPAADVQKTLGEMASAVVASEVHVGLIVVQAVLGSAA